MHNECIGEPPRDTHKNCDKIKISIHTTSINAFLKQKNKGKNRSLPVEKAPNNIICHVSF